MSLDANAVEYNSLENTANEVEVTSNATWSWASDSDWLTSDEEQTQIGDNADLPLRRGRQ